MKQNRFKSKVLWMAVTAQVGVILIATGAVSVSELQTVNTIIAAVLEILVTVGILNSPTDKEKF